MVDCMKELYCQNSEQAGLGSGVAEGGRGGGLEFSGTRRMGSKLGLESCFRGI